jgi:acyl-CoA reductase-like NAD-dependent aldehyde dehydrogenase
VAAAADFVDPAPATGRAHPALAGPDCVSPRMDGARDLLVPAPVGVVLVLVPAAGLIPTAVDNVLIALLARNAVVLLPDPAAPATAMVDAVGALAEAALAAGAPAGIVQVVAEPTEAVAAALITDPRVDAVLGAVAANGGPVVPALVTVGADLERAAAGLVDSAASNEPGEAIEGVLIVEEPVAEALLAAMQRRGAHRLSPAERDRVRDALTSRDHVEGPQPSRDHVRSPQCIGDHAESPRDRPTAIEIAARAGVDVPAGTRLLLAPLELLITEEPLARALPGPVLAVTRVKDTAAGIRAAVAVLRINGPGPGAVLHTRDPQVVVAFAAAVVGPRIVLNESSLPIEARSALVRWTRVPLAGTGLESESFDPPAGGSASTISSPVPPYPDAGTHQAARGTDG